MKLRILLSHERWDKKQENIAGKQKTGRQNSRQGEGEETTSKNTASMEESDSEEENLTMSKAIQNLSKDIQNMYKEFKRDLMDFKNDIKQEFNNFRAETKDTKCYQRCPQPRKKTN